MQNLLGYLQNLNSMIKNKISSLMQTYYNYMDAIA